VLSGTPFLFLFYWEHKGREKNLFFSASTDKLLATRTPAHRWVFFSILLSDPKPKNKKVAVLTYGKNYCPYLQCNMPKKKKKHTGDSNIARTTKINVA